MNLVLECGEFEKYLVVKRTINRPGIQYLFRFPNDYGASVVKHCFSYGSEGDLWELAVIQFVDDQNWSLCYNTEITDDVEGYLNNHDVLELLQRILDLK